MITRRQDLRREIVYALLVATIAAAAAGPREDARGTDYRQIPPDMPQLFVDDYFVDNRYNEDFMSARVAHVLMEPQRSPEPLMEPDPGKPWESSFGVGYVSVFYDPDARLFRLYYQIWNPKTDNSTNPSGYSTCYAESKDGLRWQKPVFEFVTWDGRETNILMRGEHEAKAPHVHVLSRQHGTLSGRRVRNLGMWPAEAFRGHPYVMFYCDHAHYLATSEDGLRWREQQVKVIPNRVDCFSTISYDQSLSEYVMFYRNKLIYDDRDQRTKGNTRMIARISTPHLWTLWDTIPTTVLLPDALDGGRFYNMPALCYGGLYWGFLEQFHEDPQRIQVEPAFSRDGFRWDRLPGRPTLIPTGPPESWDDGMVFASDRFIEVGNEWWLYYSAYDDFHDSRNRKGRLGLVRFGRERIIGIRADKQGKESYVITKPIVWPGGHLCINADAAKGRLLVQVSDVNRTVLAGFAWEDCQALERDAYRHTVTWRSRDMNELTDRLVRLEFRFHRADLFGFTPVTREDQDGQRRDDP